jgi:adenylate cyclase
MGKRRSQWAFCALIVVASVAAAQFSDRLSFFRLLHRKALDVHFIVRGRQAVSNIVLILMDQKSIDTFTEPILFWHPHYAQAIRAASDGGARVMGLDLAFGVNVDKWQKDYDQILAGALTTASMPVVCAFVPEFNTNQTTDPVPINLAAAGLGLVGFPNLTSDVDDFIRDQEIIETPPANADPGTPPLHSLALRVAEKYWGADVESANGLLMLAGQEIPTVRKNTIAINYAGPAGTFPRVSLADVEAAAKRGDRAQLRAWFAGKVVLLGTDDKGDRRDTPFFTLFRGAEWSTPGVEVHANTVRTLIERRFLKPAPGWSMLAALVLFCSLTAGIVMSLSNTGVGLGLLAEILVIAVVTDILFRNGWNLSTSVILVGVAFCALGSSSYRFWITQQRGALFRRAISLFVGQQVATSLDEAEEIALSGRRLSVTILFTDIRGFTAFTEKMCEEQGPEVVVKLLNEYLAMMVSLIVAYGGHVNKFIGDGILAVFCDEDKGAIPGDHALRAVQCATRMVTAPSQFETGAGLHTGLTVVGNVGSAEKMEFTVLGDTVNLASRLESLNKERHTRLLMSETTQQMLGGQVATVRLGATGIRGKSLPIDLYTVASLVPTQRALR